MRGRRYHQSSRCFKKLFHIIVIIISSSSSSILLITVLLHADDSVNDFRYCPFKDAFNSLFHFSSYLGSTAVFKFISFIFHSSVVPLLFIKVLYGSVHQRDSKSGEFKAE